MTAVAGKLLDAAIAERFFGYRWWKSRTTGARCIYAPDRNPDWMDTPADKTERLVGDWDHADWTPRFSGDWRAAGELLGQHMAVPGMAVRLYASGAGTFDVEWWCGDTCLAEVCDVDSAPLALCLAALSAVSPVEAVEGPTRTDNSSLRPTEDHTP